MILLYCAWYSKCCSASHILLLVPCYIMVVVNEMTTCQWILKIVASLITLLYCQIAFVQFPLYFVSLFHIRSVGYNTILHVIEISRQLLKVRKPISGFCIEFFELVLGRAALDLTLDFLKMYFVMNTTLQKFGLCLQINIPKKHFKIYV